MMYVPLNLEKTSTGYAIVQGKNIFYFDNETFTCKLLIFVYSSPLKTLHVLFLT